MLKLRFVVLALALVGAAWSQDSFAITGARIERGDGQVVASGTVVVRAGKIVSAGAEATVPDGVKVVDGKGWTIYPGFVDGYTTRGLKVPAAATQEPRDDKTEAPATMWEKNRKGIRSEVRAAAHLDLAASVEDFYKQGFTAGLLAPGNGTLRGRCAVANYTKDATEASLPNPDFGLEVSFRGGTGAGYPGNIMGVIALMRQTLFDAQRYAANNPEEKDAALAGAVPAVQGKMPVVFAADTENEIVRAVRIADEFGMDVMIAGGREAWKQARLLQQRGIPVLLNLNVGTKPPKDEDKGVEPGDSVPQAVRDDRIRDWTERASNAAALARGGVKFVFSSEGDSLSDFLENVRTAMAHGLARGDALKALHGGSPLLGLGTGGVFGGQNANLTIMDGDFADPASKVVRVVVNGTLVEVKS